MAEIADVVCPSCGAPRNRPFCPECGEQRITTHNYSVLHFFEHALETFTHFDYRSLRALKILGLKPGLLTREYLDGRRKPYIGPLQLFVIMNVVFALLGGQTFRVPMTVPDSDTFASMKRGLLSDAQARHPASEEEFAKEFDRTAGVQAKTWIFSMIPLYALFLAVLYGFRRYFFEHLVFATHLYAFLLLWILVVGISLGLARRAAGGLVSLQTFNAVVTLVVLVGLVAYFFLALRRTYGDGRIAAAARALVLTALFVPVLSAYRFLLFFVTLKTMHV